MLSLVFEQGTDTVGCFALEAFRIRVKRSAIGSVVIIASLPTCFNHTRDFALERFLAQAKTAELEFTVECTGPATTQTAIVLPYLELLLSLTFNYERFLCHNSLFLI